MRTALLRGRDLFDAGAYFEAHEAWEEAWLVATGRDRLFLQGLIQIAAALHKVSRAEHAGGAVRLFDAGLAKLEGVGLTDEEAGLGLGSFIESVRETREEARRWSQGGPPPRSRPRLGAEN